MWFMWYKIIIISTSVDDSVTSSPYLQPTIFMVVDTYCCIQLLLHHFFWLEKLCHFRFSPNVYMICKSSNEKPVIQFGMFYYKFCKHDIPDMFSLVVEVVCCSHILSYTIYPYYHYKLEGYRPYIVFLIYTKLSAGLSESLGFLAN